MFGYAIWEAILIRLYFYSHEVKATIMNCLPIAPLVDISRWPSTHSLHNHSHSRYGDSQR